MVEFGLTLPAEPPALANLRRLLDEWLRDAGVSAVETGELVIAINELAANAVEHAYDGRRRAGKQFEVSASIANSTVTVEVRDSGRWRESAIRPDHGRGLDIARRVQVAEDPNAVGEARLGRVDLRADRHRERAAGCKATALRRCDEIRWLAGNDLKGAAVGVDGGEGGVGGYDQRALQPYRNGSRILLSKSAPPVRSSRG